MDLSTVTSVEAGRYEFDRLDPTLREHPFLALLLRHEHVFYHWGRHDLYACQVPFIVDYDAGTILGEDGEPVPDSRWTVFDPEVLHTLLENVFTGEWGMTAADTIARLERSGIRVDIFGNESYGPKDPEAFLEELRAEL